MLNPQIAVKIVHAGALPLSDHYPDDFRKRVVKLLEKHDIDLFLNERAEYNPNSGNDVVRLQSGKVLEADLVVLPLLNFVAH